MVKTWGMASLPYLFRLPSNGELHGNTNPIPATVSDHQPVSVTVPQCLSHPIAARPLPWYLHIPLSDGIPPTPHHGVHRHHLFMMTSDPTPLFVPHFGYIFHFSPPSPLVFKICGFTATSLTRTVAERFFFFFSLLLLLLFMLSQAEAWASKRQPELFCDCVGGGRGQSRGQAEPHPLSLHLPVPHPQHLTNCHVLHGIPLIDGKRVSSMSLAFPSHPLFRMLDSLPLIYLFDKSVLSIFFNVMMDAHQGDGPRAQASPKLTQAASAVLWHHPPALPAHALGCILFCPLSGSNHTLSVSFFQSLLSKLFLISFLVYVSF